MSEWKYEPWSDQAKRDFKIQGIPWTKEERRQDQISQLGSIDKVYKLYIRKHNELKMEKVKK